MKPLLVNEIFYSIQGEGARAGEASVFVRLAGCNLACGFCDTEFESGKTMSMEQLLNAICESIKRAIPDGWANVFGTVGQWLVWTGGEPTEQLFHEHVTWFKDLGWKQAIETNGTHPAPPGLDWVVVSPKVADHVWQKNFPNGVDELRVVRHAGQPAVPVPTVPVKRKFISPLFDGNRPNKKNLKHCVQLCLENPEWSLSLQTHKLIGVL